MSVFAEMTRTTHSKSPTPASTTTSQHEGSNKRTSDGLDSDLDDTSIFKKPCPSFGDGPPYVSSTTIGPY